MALGMIRSDTGEHFDIYRDIMYAYLTIIKRFFVERGIPESAVSVEGGKKRNVSRAPHIVSVPNCYKFLKHFLPM